MKYFTIVLILIFLSCKNEPKTDTKPITTSIIQTEDSIDKSVVEMWLNFTQSNPEYRNNKLPDSDFFHNNKEDADRLGRLTIKGKKKASSGLYALYKHYDVVLPKVGNLQIVTRFDGKALAIIETKSVDTIPFHKVTHDYAALDMGTAINPLKKWKKAHRAFFANALHESGLKPSKELLVVCQRFEKLWPKSIKP